MVNHRVEEVIPRRNELRKQVIEVKDGPLELGVRKLMVTCLGQGGSGVKGEGKTKKKALVYSR